ncbi:MAG: glycine cleavage system protein GcvH [Promethearchaeota archaeon]
MLEETVKTEEIEKPEMPDKKEDSTLILPCNGIERLTGQLSGQVALNLLQLETTEKYSITPSIIQIQAQALSEKHPDTIKNRKILAINGCGIQCVNKILKHFDLIPDRSVLLPNAIKGKGFSPGKRAQLGNEDKIIAEQIAKELIQQFQEEKEAIEAKANQIISSFQFLPDYTEFLDYSYAKYEFTVPNKNEGFWFNWSDIWAYKHENGIVIGISDYMQQNLSDIIAVELPEIHTKVEQLDTVASVESSKSVFEVLSPISGEIIEVNGNLEEEPELINIDPYSKGWICVIKPSNFQAELEDLMDATQFFDQMQEKIKHDK